MEERNDEAEEKERILSAVEDFYRENPPASIAEFKMSLSTLRFDVLCRKPSTIPNSGRGLFSNTALKRGDVFTWYSGAYVTRQEYAELKKQNPLHYRDYAIALDLAGEQLMLGNYVRNRLTGALEEVPFDRLDEVFNRDGALQFMNGFKDIRDSRVNVGTFVVRSAKRMGTAGAPFSLESERRLALAFPEEILRVAVALKDIPEHTELFIPYGANYFEASAPMKKGHSFFRKGRE